MNIMYRTGYQNFYKAKNTLVYLFKVYLTAFSSSNDMVLNIIIPKLKRKWKEAAGTYMANVEFESLTVVKNTVFWDATPCSLTNLFMFHRYAITQTSKEKNCAEKVWVRNHRIVSILLPCPWRE
jgi:hypothetical protein